VTRPVEVLLYGAADCHLCDVAKRQLEAQREPLGFVLRTVDITGDPQLESAFREQIPVVFVDGHKVFKFRVEPDELRRRVLRAAQAERS
jgi:glutaredoxin